MFGRVASAKMRDALPNASYLGFTGTPIDKTAYGRGTFKTFGGEDDKGYLHKSHRRQHRRRHHFAAVLQPGTERNACRTKRWTRSS